MMHSLPAQMNNNNNVGALTQTSVNGGDLGMGANSAIGLMFN